MKSQINTNVLLFVMLAPLLMLQSCSSGYKLSEKKYNYHLNLVKAGKTKIPSESHYAVKENTVAEITPIQRPLSLTDCQQRSVLRSVQAISPLAANKHVQLCTAINSAKTIKAPNTVQINRNLVKNYGNPWDDDDDLIMNPPRIILISGIFGVSTGVCFVFAAAIPFLNFIGWLMGVAAIVFLVIWLLSLRDYHTF